MGTRRIGQALDLSRAAVLDRLEGAHRRLRHACVDQDASGGWHLTAPPATAARCGR
jgi:hypothetical protein